MITRGLAHIGIPTSNQARSVEFYQQLGFKILVNAPKLEGNNFIFLECNGVVIGIPESLDEQARRTAGTKGAGNIDHFALFVDDLDEAYAECKSKGFPFVSDSISVTEAWYPKSCRCFMIYGPDNEKIEMVEMKDRD